MKQNTMVYNKVLITIFRNFKENNKSYSKTTNIFNGSYLLFCFDLLLLFYVFTSLILFIVTLKKSLV